MSSSRSHLLATRMAGISEPSVAAKLSISLFHCLKDNNKNVREERRGQEKRGEKETREDERGEEDRREEMREEKG